MKNDDNELEQFKTDINLMDYMASYGYKLDSSESRENFQTLRRGSSGQKSTEKLVVTLKPNGNWVYYDERDQSNKGTIIDFAKKETGKSLGYVRMDLRPWVGRTSTAPAIYQAPAKPFNRDQIRKDWDQCLRVTTHPYLSFRRISAAIQQDSRFIGKFRGTGGKFNNVNFPHYDQGGFCGYEVKNKGFTGFSEGGKKGLWFSSNSTKAKRIYMMEAAIDCLSHATFSPDEQNAYISIAGSFGTGQAELIQSLMVKTQQRQQTLIIAVDNDPGGDQIAEQIQLLTDIRLDRIKPKGKDWNEDLMGR